MGQKISFWTFLFEYCLLKFLLSLVSMKMLSVLLYHMAKINDTIPLEANLRTMEP